MAKLHAEERNKLPASTFGLPAERKYPMPDASHAANAKARASQQESAGNITPAQKASIDAKADRILGGSGHMPKGDNRSSDGKPGSHWSKH